MRLLLESILGRIKKTNIKEMPKKVGIDMIRDLHFQYMMIKVNYIDTIFFMHLCLYVIQMMGKCIYMIS